MVLRLIVDVWDVRRRKLPATTLVRLNRHLADGIWEAADSEFTTVVLAESTLDKFAEVVGSG